MDVIFVTAGPAHFGSSRIRAFDLVPAFKEQGGEAVAITADRLRQMGGLGQLPTARAVVWQKVYAEDLRAGAPASTLHIWDCCDPVWWFSPVEANIVLGKVDAAICATGPLLADLREATGYKGPGGVVEDCVSGARYPVSRAHEDIAEPRLIWYGMRQNRIALAAAWAVLERAWASGWRFSLTIFDDAPGAPLFFDSAFPVYYSQWSLGKEAEVLAQHDIALLPRYPGPWGRLKSSNKMQTAAHANLPVANGESYEALEQLLHGSEARENMARLQRQNYEKSTPANAARDWLNAIDWLEEEKGR